MPTLCGLHHGGLPDGCRSEGALPPFTTDVHGSAVRRRRVPMQPVTSTAEPRRYGHATEQWFALWTTQYRLVHDKHGRLEADFTGVQVLRMREVRTHIDAAEETEPSA
jgi:hypothetical protein